MEEVEITTRVTAYGVRVVTATDSRGNTAEVSWSGRADPALMRIAAREAIRRRCLEITDAARDVSHA